MTKRANTTAAAFSLLWRRRRYTTPPRARSRRRRRRCRSCICCRRGSTRATASCRSATRCPIRRATGCAVPRRATRGRAGRTGFTAQDLDVGAARRPQRPEGARFGGWAAELDGNGDGEVDASELDAAPDEVLQRLALERVRLADRRCPVRLGACGGRRRRDRRPEQAQQEQLRMRESGLVGSGGAVRPFPDVAAAATDAVAPVEGACAAEGANGSTEAWPPPPPPLPATTRRWRA